MHNFWNKSNSDDASACGLIFSRYEIYSEKQLKDIKIHISYIQENTYRLKHAGI